jgi:phytanoyl-CoA hydroxylase
MTGENPDARFFEENGFLVKRGLLPPAVVAECLEAFVRFAGRTEPSRAEIVFDDPALGHRQIKYFKDVDFEIPVFRKLLNSEILAVASTILRQPTFFVVMEVHDKPPRGGTFTPPHQDNFYFCLDPPAAVTAYIPLEPQSAANAQLCFVPGSHREGTHAHAKSKVPAFSSGLTVDPIPEEKLFRLDARPGDVSFHHCDMVHLASENRSDLHRRAVSIRIQGTEAKVSPALKARYEEFRTYNRAETV